MKNLKLIFQESKITKKKNEEKETLIFKGFWNNSSYEPNVTLSVSGCEDGKAAEILENLDIAQHGEPLFLNQGENPQKRLDHWLTGAVRRKKPDVEDFKKEIVEFDDDMLADRHMDLYTKLEALIKDNKEETKQFDFLLECANAVAEQSGRYLEPYTKEELVSYVRGANTSQDSDPDEWETVDPIEEE